MATNMFMKLTNSIKGEAEDDFHKGWCEIKSLSQEFSNEASLSKKDPKKKIVKAAHKELKITKYVDQATTAILKACWQGTRIKCVIIECFRADGQNKALKYFGIRLDNVLIKNYELKSSEGDILEEDLELLGTKAEYTYRPMDKLLGTAKPRMIASHNLIENIVS
ncbi:MAG: type VI secretion system tube protein Hcp [Desulfobacterales bacterium]|nr:type VI secretion system tube protein Hcp [Desulfobacterales bacterium]